MKSPNAFLHTAEEKCLLKTTKSEPKFVLSFPIKMQLNKMEILAEFLTSIILDEKHEKNLWQPTFLFLFSVIPRIFYTKTIDLMQKLFNGEKGSKRQIIRNNRVNSTLDTNGEKCWLYVP